MAVELRERKGGKILEVNVTGKLNASDYEELVPEFERLLKKHGSVSVLFNMQGFHGWSAGALWEDIKFDLRHFEDIDRLAMVGEKRWQQGMSHFCRPFTTAKIRYFDHTALEEARAWSLATEELAVAVQSPESIDWDGAGFLD
jgi:hypothetical protein